MKRLFYKDFPHHVYIRGLNSNVIFYTTADCIFYVTLYSVLSRKHDIVTKSFSLMPNHIHSFQTACRKDIFINFNRELNKAFATGYNGRHNRIGSLFESPFGSAPKTVGKLIRACMSYINNNATVGGLSEHVLDYRWNLLAYRDSDHPFSQKISLEQSSIRLRRSLALVDYCYNSNRPMGYGIQKTIFEVLGPIEKKQMLDYILSRYNFLDYSGFEQYFGSFERALVAMEANGGSEHDIREDWEDYSTYSELSKIVRSMGVSLDSINFESMPSDERNSLVESMLLNSRASKRQIEKFLHFNPEG